MTLTLIPYRSSSRSLTPRSAFHTLPRWGLTPVSFADDIDRVFASFFGATAVPRERSRSTAGDLQPRVDVVETEDAVTVRVEVPGVPQQRLGLALNEVGDLLLINAADPAADPAAGSAAGSEGESDDETAAGRLYSFSREIRLPSAVTQEGSHAKLSHGVLEIQLKKVVAQVRRIEIGV